MDDAQWQRADLHKGLDSTLNIVHNEIRYVAEVIKEYGELPEVECLPSQLNPVFLNMLVNAAQEVHTAPGVGTTFRIILPMKQGAQPAAAP